MKNNLLLGFIIVMFFSCTREISPNPNPYKRATNFKEIKTYPSFVWATNKQVKFILTGLQTLIPINNKLTIRSSYPEGTYYVGLHMMNENLSLDLTIPQVCNNVEVQYGKIIKKIDIVNNRIEFDFLPALTNSAE